MPVAVIQNFTGATLDQYDQTLGQVRGLAPDSAGSLSCLFHWATPTEDGFRVTDVWQSREHFEQVAAEGIGPGAAGAGVNPPEVTFLEVYNYFPQ